jgi:putative heme-binding domain-containing protein
LNSRSCIVVLASALLASPAFAADDPAKRAKDAIIVRTLARLPGIDLSSKPEAKAALLRHLETIRGSEQWLTLVEKFQLRGLKGEALALALAEGDSSLGVKAARLLITWDERELLQSSLRNSEVEKATRLIRVIGLAADARTNDLLEPLISNGELPVALRSVAVGALARNAPGQKRLLSIVEDGKLLADLHFAAADALLSSPNEAVRAAASKHLSLPTAAGGQPLPPVAELVKRSGDTARGKELFFGVGTCAKCHKVRGEGKEVGPDLSEIGSKLSKEAMYVSILDPNAGVSFNYETWLARTLDGTVLSGILVSQTDEAIELKTAEAIVHKLPRGDLEALKKQPTSLMPADLQKQLRAEDLVDTVEYLMTLKKDG